jgi:hypothetical protein
MTHPDPAAAMAARLAPWVARAHEMVRRKVDDAAAHAAKCVTQKARRERDGRPTARLVARSPSYQAAVARLHELRIALVGQAGSLRGLLRDAREDFLTHAYELWRDTLDPRYYRVPDRPSAAAIAVARGAVIHGYALEAELAGPFEAAARGLAAACTLAARRERDQREGADQVAAWHVRTVSSLSRACTAALGDSQWALYWAAEEVLQLPQSDVPLPDPEHTHV